MVRVLTLAMIQVLLVACVTGSPTVTAAHTPGEATGAPRPGGADPANCTVAPRSLAELRDLAGNAADRDPPFEETTPVPPSALPSGEPADPGTVAEITAVVEQFMACLNALDVLRTFALVSDDLIPRMVTDADLSPEDVAVSTPDPAPQEHWIKLGEIDGVRVLADGRVGALVTAAPPDNDDPVFMIFTHTEDRWLIDDVLPVEVEHEERSAEPTETSSRSPRSAVTIIDSPAGAEGAALSVSGGLWESPEAADMRRAGNFPWDGGVAAM
ncbi:MAG: hypothetical protein ACRDJH_05940 [Thermomicrobiales bacterium]